MMAAWRPATCQDKAAFLGWKRSKLEYVFPATARGRIFHAPWTAKPQNTARPAVKSPPDAFGTPAELPELIVSRLEVGEELMRKFRQHIDDPLLVDFTCPICWEPFWEPVRTVCGHAFCESCLLKAVLAQLGQHQPDVSCPLCRNPLCVDDVFPDQELVINMRLALEGHSRRPKAPEIRSQETPVRRKANHTAASFDRVCRGLATSRQCQPLSRLAANIALGAPMQRPSTSAPLGRNTRRNSAECGNGRLLDEPFSGIIPSQRPKTTPSSHRGQAKRRSGNQDAIRMQESNRLQNENKRP